LPTRALFGIKEARREVASIALEGNTGRHITVKAVAGPPAFAFREITHNYGGQITSEFSDAKQVPPGMCRRIVRCFLNAPKGRWPAALKDLLRCAGGSEGFHRVDAGL
jgi:hypothetical protein